MYKRILVPLDGSDTSERGLQEAIGLARDEKARLHLVHVIDAFPIMVEMSAVTSFDGMMSGLRKYGQEALDQGAARARESGVQADTEMLELVSQRVPSALLAEAAKAGCDLIVMGTHGRRGFSHVMLGSTAEGVIRESAIPVLLVRHPEARKA